MTVGTSGTGARQDEDASLDVVVVGGGPAGVTAALRARELGARVALVERGRLGGTCTNDGCVPTRVLAKAARLMRDAEQFAEYGLDAPRPRVDFARVLARVHSTVERMHAKKNLPANLSAAGITVMENVGEARFADAHALALADGRRIAGARFILCAGGRPRQLAFPGCTLALTSADVWRLPALPRSVAVVGASATGTQLATIFAALGAQVTLLDLMPRILGTEDEDVSAEMARAFTSRGIRVLVGTGGVSRIDRLAGGELRLEYTLGESPEPLNVEAVLMAVGWPGNADTLDLALAGVQSQGGYIVVDDTLRTTAPHIFAAGDITGRMMLVQSASDEGIVAAENAVRGSERVASRAVVPHGGFTDPEYGAVGLTEREASALEPCAVAVVPYAELDRAVIDGRPEGFCKLIVSRATRQVLGAHVVGEQAVEIVQLVAAGMAAGARVDQLAALELAYPTFTAIVGLAARQIVRDLGGMPFAAPWRTITRARVSEWESPD